MTLQNTGLYIALYNIGKYYYRALAIIMTVIIYYNYFQTVSAPAWRAQDARHKGARRLLAGDWWGVLVKSEREGPSRQNK